MRRATLAALAVSALVVAPVNAAVEWRKVDPAAVRSADVGRLEQLARDFPDSGAVRLALLNAYLAAGRTEDALDEIVLLSSRGYAFGAASQAGLLELYAGETRARLAELFAAEHAQLEASDLLATVPAEALLVEGAAYDARTGRLFASTIVSRELFVRSSGGAWTTLELSDPGSLASMVIDERRRTLWVASGSFDETPEPKQGFRGVFGIDLDTGETIRKVAPQDSTPSDIALDDDGRLYASDPFSGAIYHALPDHWRMTPLVGPGTFRSPQGLVPWEGGVIVSDYGYGLAFVDEAGKVWRIGADAPMLLDGIDGMWRHGARIVAIQNGARPARIVELSMSADGRRVTGVSELERAHPAWTEPLGGTIVGDNLVYVATGQWAAFGPGGTLREGAGARPTELRILPLGETAAAPP